MDWDALLEKEKEKIHYSKEAEEGFLPLLYPDAVDYAKNIIMLPDFSQTTDLKNGDTVQYHWDFSEESVKNLAIPLSLKGGSYKVSGLTKEDEKKASDATDSNKGNKADGTVIGLTMRQLRRDSYIEKDSSLKDRNYRNFWSFRDPNGGTGRP